MKKGITFGLAGLALTTSLYGEKLPGTDYDPNNFESGKFINAIASDIALSVCEDNRKYIDYVIIGEDNPLRLDNKKAFSAKVKIKDKKNGYQTIQKNYKSHVDRHKMGEIFTVTTNLQSEIRTYSDKINNVFNYISSKENPCDTALKYAKHYKIVDKNYKLEK